MYSLRELRISSAVSYPKQKVSPATLPPTHHQENLGSGPLGNTVSVCINNTIQNKVVLYLDKLPLGRINSEELGGVLGCLILHITPFFTRGHPMRCWQSKAFNTGSESETLSLTIRTHSVPALMLVFSSSSHGSFPLAFLPPFLITFPVRGQGIPRLHFHSEERE